MAEDDSQERTEDATLRRKEQAREKGQLPRSRELAAVTVMVVGAIALIFLGDLLAKALFSSMKGLFALSRTEIFSLSFIKMKAYDALLTVFKPLFLLLIIFFIAGLFGAFAVGGISFSWQAASPKLSKLNPLQGLKRMVSLQSLIELIKSLLKIGLIAGMGGLLIWLNLDDLYQLSIEPFPINFYHALKLILNFVVFICASLLIVVAIDVPFQLWQHNQQLKMTKHEIKDEHKDIEGKPEVKGRIRMLQRELAQRRMMEKIPQADVIIANPEHYSVALRYNSQVDKAPIVIAKGVDFMALKIREIGKKHDILVISAAPLARAIYHHSELEQQIPDALFLSVAQILAYVFQLRAYQKGTGQKPTPLDTDNLPIPAEFEN